MKLLASGLFATCGRCGVTHGVVVPAEDFRCEGCAVEEIDEAAALRTRGGWHWVAIGAVLLMLAVLMGMAGWNPGEDAGAQEGWGLLPYVAIGGIGLVGIGLGSLQYRPRLRH